MWEGAWAEFREGEGGGELVNLLPNTFACNLIICNNIMDFYMKNSSNLYLCGPLAGPYRVVGGVHFAKYYSIICLSYFLSGTARVFLEF